MTETDSPRHERASRRAQGIPATNSTRSSTSRGNRQQSKAPPPLSDSNSNSYGSSGTNSQRVLGTSTSTQLPVIRESSLLRTQNSASPAFSPTLSSQSQTRFKPPTHDNFFTTANNGATSISSANRHNSQPNDEDDEDDMYMDGPAILGPFHIPGSSEGPEDGANHDDDDDSHEESTTPSRTPRGPIPAEYKAMMEKSFQLMDDIVLDLAKKTSRSVDNIHSHFRARHAGTQSEANYWNLFQSGVAAGQKGGSSDAASRSQSYRKLKSGSNFNQLMEMYAEHQATQQIEQTTVGQRKANFKKFEAALASLCDRNFKKFGFEAVVLGIGNLVNSDGGLHFITATEGVKDFIETLPIDANTLIAILRTQAFNSEIERNLDSLRKFLAEIHPELLKPSDLGALAEHGVDAEGVAKLLGLIRRHFPTLCPSDTGPSSSTTAPAPPAAQPEDDKPTSEAGLSETGTEDEEAVKNRAIFHGFMVKEIERLDYTFPKGGNFPWKNLETKLIPFNLVIHNWPEPSAFPTGSEDKSLIVGEKRKTCSTARTGIRGALGTAGLRALANACTSTGPDRLRVERGPGKELLVAGKAPWIIGVTPSKPDLGRRECYAKGKTRRQTVFKDATAPPASKPTSSSPHPSSKPALTGDSVSSKRAHPPSDSTSQPESAPKRARSSARHDASHPKPGRRAVEEEEATPRGPRRHHHSPEADATDKQPARPQPRKRFPGFREARGPERFRDSSCTPNPFTRSSPSHSSRSRSPSVDPFDLSQRRQPVQTPSAPVQTPSATAREALDGNFAPSRLLPSTFGEASSFPSDSAVRSTAVNVSLEEYVSGSAAAFGIAPSAQPTSTTPHPSTTATASGPAVSSHPATLFPSNQPSQPPVFAPETMEAGSFPQIVFEHRAATPHQMQPVVAPPQTPSSSQYLPNHQQPTLPTFTSPSGNADPSGFSPAPSLTSYQPQTFGSFSVSQTAAVPPASTSTAQAHWMAQQQLAQADPAQQLERMRRMMLEYQQMQAAMGAFQQFQPQQFQPPSQQPPFSQFQPPFSQFQPPPPQFPPSQQFQPPS